jgi:hypothetical protein
MGGFLSGKTSLTTVQTADIAADAITLAKLAGGTDGELITWDASGDPAAVGAGTSGHFLKSQGAGSVPVFAADNKGAMTFINTTDISSAASYEFTAFDASLYDSYEIHFMNIIPVTDDVSLELLVSTDAGSSYQTGASDYSWRSIIDATHTSDDADDSIEMEGSTANNYSRWGSSANEDGGSFILRIMAPHLSKRTIFYWSGYFITAYDGVYGRLFSGGGIRRAAEDTTGVKVLFSSGNIESGTITAYGIANA